MALVAPPAKIKAALATILETLESSKQPPPTVHATFLNLWRVELLLRGVVVDATASSTTILQAIQSHAGKSLVEDPTLLPPQLLAGTAFVAGRLAERIAHQWSNTTEAVLLWPDLESTSRDESNHNALTSCLARCRQVEDERLHWLVSLAVSTTTQPTPVRHVWIVAEGYMLRAARFQPDAPPMWKKAWDCVSQQYDTMIHWQATTAVTHLHRIAVAKHNVKRAAELALILADCQLQAAAIATSRDTSDPTGHTQLATVFVAPERAMVPPTPTAAVAAAQATLSAQSPLATLSPDDALYRHVLMVQCQCAEWDTSVETLAATDCARGPNRVAAAPTDRSSAPSMASCRLAAARAWHWTDVALYATLSDQRHDRATALRDNVMGSNVVTRHEAAAWTVLRNHVDWCLDRARTMATATPASTEATRLQGYRDAATFVEPLWEYLRHRLNEGNTRVDHDDTTILERITASMVSPEKWRCFETVCLAIPTIEWMLQEPHTSPPHSADRLLLRVLQVFEQARIETRQQQKEALNVIGTNLLRDTVLDQLTGCVAHVSARRVLEMSPPRDIDAQFDIARRATARSSAAAPVVVCGSAYLECLVCWSGWHQTPWSFCTQPEARRLVRQARDDMNQAHQWGRPISTLEQTILELGEADAEGLAFDVGLAQVARAKYRSVMASAESLANGVLKDVMISHCYTALAELEARESTNRTTNNPATDSFVSLARSGLDRMLAVSLDAVDPNETLFLWRSPQLIEHTLRFRISAARQLVADAMLRSGDSEAAHTFLQDATRDAPLDASAAFALGRFRLYLLFFGNERSPENEKAAQVQLLRAAKMDSTRAGPFALLGYWYEYKSDFARALGCYSKALVLDPTHPVAGRGLVRLAPPEALERVLEPAIDTASAVNGWAWSAVGLRKSLSDGRDDQAVISFLRALRCRDIERPEVEPLAAFYAHPMHPRLPSHNEMSSTLAALAACYRRLGRYTAAIRSYHAAIHEAGDEVSGWVLCACAQVELELGLFDDAVEKFAAVETVESQDEVLLHVAAYGNGVALLCVAQRAVQDGKADMAHSLLCDGLGILERSGVPNRVCSRKLRGDLYSFAAALPLRVFGEVNDASRFQQHVEFVSQGAISYKQAETLVMGTSDESVLLRASLLTDVGSNLLLQAQLTLSWEGKGLHLSPSENALSLLNEANLQFRSALDVLPTYAPAWCGLGCALVHSDPLLAQHALVRAIELDKLSPDAYANLSFLYTAHQRYDSSTGVSDALTEVADTPMMWINRAFIFEQTASTGSSPLQSRQLAVQAADAYRASLQVMQHPSALLGLAVTCRVSSRIDASPASTVLESYNWASVYAENYGSCDIPSILIEKALQMEVGTMEYFGDHGHDLVCQGRQGIQTSLDAINDFSDPHAALSLGVFQELAASADGDPAPAEQPMDTNDWNLHRQLVHAPNRGDLWIRWAQELVSRVEANAPATSLQPALVAARRASTILQQQWNQTLRAPATHTKNTVQAHHVSDALALQYWLESMVHSSEADTENKATTCNIVELQRSLLICPGNAMARQALDLAQVTV